MTHFNPDDRIDRYIRGELAPAEARKLAQDSLDDAELFDELTYSAVAKKAVVAGLPRGNVVRFWRPRRLIIAGSIAAAIVVASVYALRLRTPSGMATSSLHATLDPARGGVEPVLLAAELPGVPEQQQVFRGAEPESSPPKSSGVVVAVDGATAEIDAGAVDGLTLGTELDVHRDGAVVGHVHLTAVFRERARGSVDGRVRAHDEAPIPPGAQLTARMERVRAMAARGDLAAARAYAEEAVGWAGAAGVSPSAQAAAWNTLAVLRLLQSDRAGGELLLRRALAATHPTDASHALILNNLGVLAESAGDRAGARERYGSALRALSGDSAEAQREKRGIESNLSRLDR